MSEFIQSIKDSIYINLIYEDRYLFILKGFGMTLYLSVMTFLLGTVVGAIICRLRLSNNTVVARVVVWFKNIFIRLPTLVLLIIFAYWLFANTGVDTVTLAILAFALKAGSYISDIIYTAIITVDKGEVEAGRTLGMSSFKVFRLVVLPQAIKTALPVYKNQLIITMQETSLVGFLAVNDLTRASQVITSRTMDPYISLIITVIAYLVIGGVSSLLFKFAEREKHLEFATLKKQERGKAL
jgi:His/Glu/Gln/Arg/opine family amino acid ABC transporter permease subunit